jgi:hypothetical protein
MAIDNGWDNLPAREECDRSVGGREGGAKCDPIHCPNRLQIEAL